MNWILNLILNAIRELAILLMTASSSLVNGAMSFGLTACSDTIVIKACDYTRSIGRLLMVLFIVKKAFDIYVLGKGEEEDHPIYILERMVRSLAVIICVQRLFDILAAGSQLLINEITVTLSVNEQTSFMDKLISWCQHDITPDAVLIQILASVIMFILTLFLCLKLYFRGAELALYKIISCILAIDLSSKEHERWDKFVQKFLTCAYGCAIQIMCFMIACNVITEMDSLSFGSIFLMIAWLRFSISAPKWLEEFVYTSGTGQDASKVASMAYTVKMLIPRKVA